MFVEEYSVRENKYLYSWIELLNKTQYYII